MFPITQVSLLAVNYLPTAQLVLGGWGSYLLFFYRQPKAVEHASHEAR